MNSTTQNTAFIDSGASGHYIHEDAPVTKSNRQDPAISVGQPGGDIMTSKYNCDININSLPINARKGYVIPGLHTSLLSVGKCCDEGLITIFTKDKVHVCNPTPEMNNILQNIEKHSAVNG